MQRPTPPPSRRPVTTPSAPSPRSRPLAPGSAGRAVRTRAAEPPAFPARSRPGSASLARSRAGRTTGSADPASAAPAGESWSASTRNRVSEAGVASASAAYASPMRIVAPSTSRHRAISGGSSSAVRPRVVTIAAATPPARSRRPDRAAIRPGAGRAATTPIRPGAGRAATTPIRPGAGAGRAAGAGASFGVGCSAASSGSAGARPPTLPARPVGSAEGPPGRARSRAPLGGGRGWQTQPDQAAWADDRRDGVGPAGAKPQANRRDSPPGGVAADPSTSRHGLARPSASDTEQARQTTSARSQARISSESREHHATPDRAIRSADVTPGLPALPASSAQRRSAPRRSRDSSTSGERQLTPRRPGSAAVVVVIDPRPSSAAQIRSKQSLEWLCRPTTSTLGKRAAVSREALVDRLSSQRQRDAALVLSPRSGATDPEGFGSASESGASDSSRGRRRHASAESGASPVGAALLPPRVTRPSSSRHVMFSDGVSPGPVRHPEDGRAMGERRFSDRGQGSLRPSDSDSDPFSDPDSDSDSDYASYRESPRSHGQSPGRRQSQGSSHRSPAAPRSGLSDASHSPVSHASASKSCSSSSSRRRGRRGSAQGAATLAVRAMRSRAETAELSMRTRVKVLKRKVKWKRHAKRVGGRACPGQPGGETAATDCKSAASQATASAGEPAHGGSASAASASAELARRQRAELEEATRAAEAEAEAERALKRERTQAARAELLRSRQSLERRRQREARAAAVSGRIDRERREFQSLLASERRLAERRRATRQRRQEEALAAARRREAAELRRAELEAAAARAVAAEAAAAEAALGRLDELAAEEARLKRQLMQG